MAGQEMGCLEVRWVVWVLSVGGWCGCLVWVVVKLFRRVGALLLVLGCMRRAAGWSRNGGTCSKYVHKCRSAP